VSYIEPDTHASGALLASRVRNHSDVWKIPAVGSPSENTRDAVRITRQTGVAQTPSVSPDDTEVVYLSDSGGHGNLWVAKTDGTSVRQLTFEQDPATSVGVPVWSPIGSQIAFILTKSGTAAQWLINRDGSGLRQVTTGVWAYWTPDGRWLYYMVQRDGTNCIDKVPTAGGAPVMVRCDNAVAPAIGPDGSMYFVTPLIRGTGGWDMDIRRARPENAAATVLARLAGSRVPGGDAFNIHTIVSPDGKWLALPLTDGVTSNLWILPADGGAMRPITDFGQRPVMIVRRISWSPDGRFIYAAVAETDADVVLLDGLLR
jgi:Tol biopolymer transport system component